MTEAKTWLDFESDQDVDLLANVIDGRTLDQQVFPPLEWVVQSIIPQGFGLLVSPPKAGKSWFVGGVGLACAAGGKALGHIEVAQRPVLYLALEDGHRRLQHRYRHLLSGARIPEEMYSLTGIGLHSVTDVMTAFLEKHDGRKPVIFLDTLGKVKPSKRINQDSYQADYAIGSALKATIDAFPGSTLLAVHHTRKMESEDFIDAVSGTQGIAGSADFVLVLSRKRQSDEATLSITGRDVEESEVALVTNGGAWSLSSPSFAKSAEDAIARRERGNKGDRTIRALEFVKSRPTTNPMELAAWLDVDPDIAGRYMRRMYTDGLIDKASRGVYEPLSEVSGVSGVEEGSDSSDADLEEPELPLTRQKDTPDTSDTTSVEATDLPRCSVHNETIGRTGKCIGCITDAAAKAAS